MAATLVEMLAFFFPHAIDTLSREEGIVDGPLPVVFSGFDLDDIQLEMFFGSQGGSSIEFGAETCTYIRVCRYLHV